MNRFKIYPLNRLVSSITVLSLFVAMIFYSCKKDDNRNNPENGGSNNTSACAGGPGTVTDVDGNTYNVVTIGNQCWMQENLKTTKYRNGSAIPGNLSDAAWSSTTSGAQADYNNNVANTAIYGKLYNWYAVADPAGLCPTGWHVPSDAEWNELVKFLDPGADTSIMGTQSTIAGGMLKATGTQQAGTGLWEAPNTDATDSSSFTGLPGGYRDIDGTYKSIDLHGTWWSSTQYPATYAWFRYLSYNQGFVSRTNFHKKNGFSVRCVRD